MSDEIVTVRPDSALLTRQNLPNFVGVSALTCGSRHLSMNLVVIPEKGRAVPHLHRGFETAIDLLRGRVQTFYGPGLTRSVINEAGDFIFIPADPPHRPVSHPAHEVTLAIVARNHADEQKSVEPYPMEGGKHEA